MKSEDECGDITSGKARTRLVAALSPWDSAETVGGFVGAAPNRVLTEYAARLRHQRGAIALDIGCGAGRNAVPLAASGWTVLGTDLSCPMLAAARERSGA